MEVLKNLPPLLRTPPPEEFLNISPLMVAHPPLDLQPQPQPLMQPRSNIFLNFEFPERVSVERTLNKIKRLVLFAKHANNLHLH